MRFFSSEFAHSYQSYSFGYCNYLELEKKDQLSLIYERGFLPYSGKEGVKDIFYMARSARLVLKNFELNSENRRITKRFDESFTKEDIPLQHFDWKNPVFLKFCTNYFLKRHGRGVMPRGRLFTILDAGLISHIKVYRSNGSILAYVFEVGDEEMTHFWYSFYDLLYARQSLGMWLMIDAARDAQKRGKKYFYLGTVYAEKALYKTNFDALEYWTGEEWSNDRNKLRTRGRTDVVRKVRRTDEWKETHLVSGKKHHGAKN